MGQVSGNSHFLLDFHHIYGFKNVFEHLYIFESLHYLSDSHTLVDLIPSSGFKPAGSGVDIQNRDLA